LADDDLIEGGGVSGVGGTACNGKADPGGGAKGDGLLANLGPVEAVRGDESGEGVAAADEADPVGRSDVRGMLHA